MKSITKIFVKNFTISLLLLVSLLMSATSLAGPIVVSGSGGAYQIDAHEPVGQSFTAEDQNVLFAFSLFDVNQFSDPSNGALTVRMLSGNGTGGLELGAVSQVVTPNIGSISSGIFVDFDFTFLNLIVGQHYTAILEAPTARWGVDGGSTNLYAGGTAYVGGGVANGDFDFRVTPVAQVSEPGIFSIFGLGLAVMGFVRRRRQLVL